MDLSKLKQEIPFKWRVQSSNQYGAKCVAYIDARQVQDLLDDVCGVENWQVKYEEHKGNLFASIGIYTKHNDWAWKSDCGTESNVEKEKGEASDSFKRAAVMWGVGRFLYSKKILTIKDVKTDNKGRYYPVDSKGVKIWDITEHCNNMMNGLNNQPQKSYKKQDEELLNNCKTLDDLKNAFASLPPDRKALVNDLKDRLKLELK